MSTKFVKRCKWPLEYPLSELYIVYPCLGGRVGGVEGRNDQPGVERAGNDGRVLHAVGQVQADRLYLTHAWNIDTKALTMSL